jgi:hypothetical protein
VEASDEAVAKVKNQKEPDRERISSAGGTVGTSVRRQYQEQPGIKCKKLRNKVRSKADKRLAEGF